MGGIARCIDDIQPSLATPQSMNCYLYMIKNTRHDILQKKENINVFLFSDILLNIHYYANFE